jgi:hypothetical protein
LEEAMAGKNYTDLIAWQKAMELVEEIYKASTHFPREEIYGLTAQLRRAAISIPSNIAEGQGRQSRREFRQFLSFCALPTVLCARLRRKFSSPNVCIIWMATPQCASCK